MSIKSCRRMVLLFFTLQLIFTGCDSPEHSIYQEYATKLDAIRDKNLSELHEYMNFVQKEAAKISSDQVMRQLFLQKHDYYLKQKAGDRSLLVRRKLAQLRDTIENRYIDEYLIFHDILFIDREGNIFYTIKRGADYHKNVFRGKLAQTALSEQLKQKPTETFIDFHNYELSDDPSAFFVEPIISESQHTGWYVLQCSINKLNDIFIIEDVLGSTGEVFLVNKDSTMITDSRFFAESTILKQHLSEENIRSKFAEGEGNKMVIDYRGYRALTSFKVTSVLNSNWLLIAKIDEDEIITEKYRRDSDTIRKKLIQLSRLNINRQQSAPVHLEKEVEVDMDEFKRVSHGEALYTHGVSFCTAIVISLKGKFAYMGHISARDRIYGGTQTDLVRRMLKRIDDFDLVRSEKRKVEITIVSPQVRYTENLIDRFVEWGVFLSQITLAHDPQARYANLSHHYLKGETAVQWKLQSTGESYSVALEKLNSLGDILTQKTLSAVSRHKVFSNSIAALKINRGPIQKPDEEIHGFN